jgi:hypothetical protein
MTTPLQEITIAGMHDKSATEALRICYRQVRILGLVLLLGAVWGALFLWGLEMTGRWLAWWVADQNTSNSLLQLTLADLLQSTYSLYLLAFAPVLISLALFFYRIPRVKRRLSVALEFVLTTALFVTFNLLVVQFLQRMALAAADLASVQAPGLELNLVHLISQLNLTLTLVMLFGLFWLQGSGYLRASWRHWRREIPT